MECDTLESLLERYGVTRNLLVLSFARLADAFGNGLLIIVIPLYIATFKPAYGIPLTFLTGIVMAAYGFGSALFQPLFGVATDRLGRRKPFLVYGLMAVALTTFGFSFVYSFGSLLAANLLRGVAVAITLAPAMALVTEITQQETRGGSMGVYTTTRTAGFAVAPLFAGVMVETIGYTSVFVLGASMAIFSSLLVYLWVSEPPRKVPATETGSVFARNGGSEGGWKAIPRDIYVLGVAVFFMVVAISMMTALEKEFNQMLDQTAIGFSIAFSALIIARIFTQAPLGRLSDTWGRKKFIVVGMILMGLFTVFLPYVQSTLQLTAIRMLQGVMSAAIMAPGMALAADKTGENKGAEMSVLTTSFMLGLSAGPLLSGFLASYLSFESPFWLGGGLLVIGGLLTLFYVEETVHV